VGARIFVVTGTDTGVGKTVLTVLLARHLHAAGVRVAALKPVSSGTRNDARALRAALGGRLTLDEINPWHFRAPVAPLLAARLEKRRVRLADVVDHTRAMARRCDVLLVEGAGGLMSPIGEIFTTGDLLAPLKAVPIIVTPNRLGAVNQVLLVLHTLPVAAAKTARVVLMAPLRPDMATRSNARLLAELVGKARIHVLPWLSRRARSPRVKASPAIVRTLARFLLPLPRGRNSTS